MVDNNTPYGFVVNIVVGMDNTIAQPDNLPGIVDRDVGIELKDLAYGLADDLQLTFYGTAQLLIG